MKGEYLVKSLNYRRMIPGTTAPVTGSVCPFLGLRVRVQDAGYNSQGTAGVGLLKGKGVRGLGL